MTWADQAACRGADRRMFTGHLQRLGRPLCDRCPVADICLWDAISHEEAYGLAWDLYGGHTAVERRAIARSLAAGEAAHRLAAALDRWASQPAAAPTKEATRTA